jgi:hypothetical protein
MSMVLFSINLLCALPVARKAQSDEEIEQVMVPAMRARDNSRHVPGHIKSAFRTVFLGAVGIFLGVAGILLLRTL